VHFSTPVERMDHFSVDLKSDFKGEIREKAALELRVRAVRGWHDCGQQDP
jgi:hypothetical protein